MSERARVRSRTRVNSAACGLVYLGMTSDQFLPSNTSRGFVHPRTILMPTDGIETDGADKLRDSGGKKRRADKAGLRNSSKYAETSWDQ